MLGVWDGFLSPFWKDVMLTFLVIMVIANRIKFWLLEKSACGLAESYVRETGDYKDITRRYADLIGRRLGDVEQTMSKAAEDVKMAAESFEIGSGETRKHKKSPPNSSQN